MLVDLIEILQRNAITLIGLPVVFGLAAFLISLRVTPSYTAKSLLQVDPGPARRVARALEDPYQPGHATDKYYNTQLKILNSRKLAEKLVDRLNLDTYQEFSGPSPSLRSKVGNITNWLPFLPPPPPPQEPNPEFVRQVAILSVRSSLDIELITNTNLFNIGFRSEDPELAAIAANTFADIYIEELLEAKLDVTKKAAKWLTENLAEISRELSQSEGQLQSFRDTEQLVNVRGSR